MSLNQEFTDHIKKIRTDFSGDGPPGQPITEPITTLAHAVLCLNEDIRYLDQLIRSHTVCVSRDLLDKAPRSEGPTP